MPDGGLFSILPGMLSAGSALGGLFGGGGKANAGNIQAPPSWQMPNMTGIANQAQSDISGLSGMNLPAQLIPQYQAVTGQMGFGNPFAPSAITNAANTGAAGMGVGANMLGAGNLITGAGANLLPYSTNLLQSGFDPQQALYGRTLQQLQDQTRSGLEARGIDSTPYGAGVEADALRNFNIDWQNNQLQRQLAAGQGAANLTGAAGGAFNTGAGLGSQGLSTMAQYGMLPYSTYGGIAGDTLSGLNTLGQAGLTATQIPQMAIGDWTNLLGVGNQAGQVANQAFRNQLDQSNLLFNQQQKLGQQFGAGLQGISKGLGWGTPGQTGWGGSKPFGWGGGGLTNDNLLAVP